jgi:hypothetical protein
VLVCAIVMATATVAAYDDTLIHPFLAFGDLFEYLVDLCGRYPYSPNLAPSIPQNLNK